MRCMTNPGSEIGRVVVDSWMDGSRDNGAICALSELDRGRNCRSFAILTQSRWKQMNEKPPTISVRKDRMAD